MGSAAGISLTIANTGTGNVTFSKESLSGGAFTATPLVLPYILAPGKRFEVTIRFAPKSPGQFGGYIELESDATNGTVYCEMTGTGVAAAEGLLTATPSSASFGSVPLGMSNSQAVELKNSGTLNTTISAAVVGSANFTLVGLKMPVVLAPGETIGCTLVTTPVTGLNYADDAVVAGETYTYAVTAVDSSGQEGTYSSPAPATIP